MSSTIRKVRSGAASARIAGQSPSEFEIRDRLVEHRDGSAARHPLVRAARDNVESGLRERYRRGQARQPGSRNQDLAGAGGRLDETIHRERPIWPSDPPPDPGMGDGDA